jgi:glycosyltransferase involved in cell wall biosynthesis
VREQRIDVVHTFFPTSDLWAGPIAKLSGARVLISSRRDMGFSRTTIHKIGYRLLGGVFDQIQTVSNSIRQYTIETDKVDPGRTSTIYNGVDPGPEVTTAEVDSLRRTLEFQPGAPVIGCVANWRRIKGLDVLVRAAVLVGKQMPEARFFIAGQLGVGQANEVFTKEVQELNRSLGNEHRMRFLGASTQVPALLKMSDVFVLPSRSEGLSNALLEAMRAGLPCVATAVGGNPEVVVDGKTGFIVPPDRPEELADSILKILRDPKERQRMGARGRDRVLQNFSVDSMVSAVMAEYARLLEGKNSNCPLSKRILSKTH